MSTIVKTIVCVLVLATMMLQCALPKKIEKKNAGANPINILLIVADDLGRQDIAPYGNKFIETQNLQRMANEGVLFTNAYAAAPLCSPTRASIISGNNPARINLTEHLHGYAPPPPTQKLAPPRIVAGLPPDLNTIPKVLSSIGYATAHFGKWHLGSGPSSPVNCGFQYSYGGGQEGLPKSFFYPFFWGQPYKDLLADSKHGDYLDDILTNRAISYIKEQGNKPFFVELNFYAPHVPIEGKPELVQKYAAKRKSINYSGLPEDEYAAMVENIDFNIGRVLDFLKEQGLDQNTIVLFTSDNGGLDVEEVPAFAKFTPPTSNAPFKGGKGYLYEGGIREPWIIWMPALVKNSRYEDAIVSTDDIFNTFMEIAGSDQRSPDGNSFLPLINGKKMEPRDYLLHFPHYSPQRGKPGAVIRRGNYKLIEWYENGNMELFDLEKDPSESRNIFALMPDKVKELKAALDAWRDSLQVQMPELNPNYRPGNH